MSAQSDHSLEFLLAFDGRRHLFEGGYWVKFEIRRAEPTKQRPHGLRYSFTLHDPNGKGLVGFDNAHGVSVGAGRFKRPAVAHDHWHRTGNDPGRPYAYIDAVKLLDDFEAEVRRVRGESGIGSTVVAVEGQGGPDESPEL